MVDLSVLQLSRCGRSGTMQFGKPIGENAMPKSTQADKLGIVFWGPWPGDRQGRSTTISSDGNPPFPSLLWQPGRSSRESTSRTVSRDPNGSFDCAQEYSACFFRT